MCRRRAGIVAAPGARLKGSMIERPSPSLMISFLALFIALSGTSCAVAKLPQKSVSTAQLKNSAVTTPKVKNDSLLAPDFKPGQLPTGVKGEKGDRGETGPSASAGAERARTPAFNLPGNTSTLMLSLAQFADRTTGPLTIGQPSRLIVNSALELLRQYSGSGLTGATRTVEMSSGGPWQQIGDDLLFQEVGNPSPTVSSGAFTTFVDVDPGTYDLRLMCFGAYSNEFALAKGSITVVATGR